jgi:hypothetical protein
VAVAAGGRTEESSPEEADEALRKNRIGQGPTLASVGPAPVGRAGRFGFEVGDRRIALDEVAVNITMETRGTEHEKDVLNHIKALGHDAQVQ